MGHLVLTSSSSILFTGSGLLTLNPSVVEMLMRASREIAEIDIFIVGSALLREEESQSFESVLKLLKMISLRKMNRIMVFAFMAILSFNSKAN